MATEELLVLLDAHTAKFDAKLKSTNDKLDDLTTKAKKSDDTLKKLSSGFKIAAASVVGATAAFVAYATAQGRAMRETEALATMAGITTKEFKKLSFVMGTAGISGEKFGEIMKDTQERIGDFLATGGGPLVDFIDVMSLTEKQAISLAKEFETMSGQDVLQAMVNQMQAAGKSTQQMSFALEGMASDTTRLIPLLKDNGKLAKELGDRFDEIDISLSEEEQKQFVALANNTDLAQKSFVNFINNAISPFLPAINKAAEGLANFFASANAGIEIDQIIDDKEIIKDINSLDTIDKLLRRIKKEQEELSRLQQSVRERANAGSETYVKRLQKQKDVLTDISVALDDQKDAITKVNEEKAKIPTATAVTSSATDELTGVGKSENKNSLLEELEALQEAKKTKLQLLREEKEERLEILEEMYKGDADLASHYSDLKKQVEDDFKLSLFEESQTEEEKRIEAFADELANLKEFYSEKLMTEEDYYARRNEIINEFAPSVLNPDLLEEENQVELEKLKALLDQKLILEREYFEKIAELQNKDLKDKDDKTKKEDWWSKSSTKSQMDQGTQLLQSLGNNSKVAHKIKQGLAVANAGMNTSEGITKALADQNYVGAALTAATGATQIAAILSSSPNGSGGGSGSSAPQQPQQPQQQNFQPDTTSLQLSNQTESGGSTGQIRFATDSGDELMDTIAKMLNKGQQEGRFA